MRNDILEKKEIIIKMVDDYEPKAKICKFLKCKPETLDCYLKKFGVNYKGNRGAKGKKNAPNKISAIDYMKKEIVITSKLRKKLISDGIKKNECEMCGITKWLGKEISLELHHIDGDRFNNVLSNLQILCPNCHSLTPNHSQRKDLVK
jgi:5-methylcytosine-specific restriction endonuclease McrA